jgi:AcrR family transcriptional regulator
MRPAGPVAPSRYRMATSPRTATPRPARPADPATVWQGRRRRADHDLKRDAVIRAAARSFNDRGYHNTSLDDIAGALGVTKPTVYYYVENKEQLLFECFRAGLEPIREALDAAEVSPDSGRERLRRVIADYARAIASEYGWCMVRAEHQDLGPELSRQVKALKSGIDQGIRRLLRRGIEDGSIEPCDERIAAFAIAGALNWIAHWYREGQQMGADAVADAYVAFLENALQPRGTSPAKSVRGRTQSG